jgi:hypothetical protein
MKRAYVLAISLAGAMGPLTVSYARETLSVDVCLDSGGSYDYSSNRCDHSVSHPHAPYSARHTGLLYGSGVLAILALAVSARLTQNPPPDRKRPGARAGA